MNILLRKFPYNGEGGWMKVSIIAAVIVFLILALLQPFGLSNADTASLIKYSFIFCAVSFVLTYLYGKLVFVPANHKVKSWRVWHQVVGMLGLLIVISLGNGFMDMALFGNPFSVRLLAGYLFATFVIGAFIVTLITILAYQKYLKNQLELLLDKDKPSHDGEMITLRDSSVRGENFTIAVNDFLYAEVQKNDIIVYYQSDGRVKTHEMRMTLQAFVDCIKFKHIIQCHRSFVVNIDNITSAKGNSNGYKLLLGNCENIVPVSRSFVPLLKSFIS